MYFLPFCLLPGGNNSSGKRASKLNPGCLGRLEQYIRTCNVTTTLNKILFTARESPSQLFLSSSRNAHGDKRCVTRLTGEVTWDAFQKSKLADQTIAEPAILKMKSTFSQSF